MKVGLVGQKDNPRARSLLTSIGRSLMERDIAVAVDTVTAEALSADRGRGFGAGRAFEPESIEMDDIDQCDLVVSIGGDGTFLFASRGIGETPIVGVNLGEVGFLNAVAPDDAIDVVNDVVSDLQSGATEVYTMPRIQASGDGWTLPPSLNEVVIQGPQRGHGNGIGVTVRVDGSLYTSGHADGVLTATATGSTAYNLSEGGPLVHPDVDGMVVTEMAAELEMPPLVVDGESEITVRVENEDSATVVSDGRISREIQPPARVTIRRADSPVRVAGPSLDFFTALGKLE